MADPEQRSPAGVELADRLAEHRAVRRELERDVLPLATSVDGWRFEFQASLYDLVFQPGGYVALEDAGGKRLGQVLTVDMFHTDSGSKQSADYTPLPIRAARGTGMVLAGDFRPFHDALARPAEPVEVGDWLRSVRPERASLEIGELLHAPGIPAVLDAGGFDRHTFMCGQSGSGKTYSLGLVLERLLLETGLRMVILDPNSDYVRLVETRETTAPEIATRYADATREISVRRGGAAGAEPIRVGFAELSPQAQAALLELDPIADRAEYAALTAILETRSAGQPLIRGLDDLLTADIPGARELGQRASNLGVLDWAIWARGQPHTLVEALADDTIRCLVVDIGSLDTREEMRVIAEAVLSTLWQRRTRREPVLIVIDEAHNVCPAEPEDPVTALAAETTVRIAAEGRKFGLYLLVSTQRPQKVHENVLSQCDNLLLMRMNSAADLEYLRAVFSFVPGGLLERATSFRQGQALVAGKIASHATHVRFGARYAEEGGTDVPTSWAALKPIP